MLGENGRLAGAIAGYEFRPSQLRMAEIVEHALEHDGVALIEAGTGTGKTLGYLVPAVLSDRRVVVSTGTRTLQDQILERDVPIVERALAERVPIVALKGLSNYLCLRRYDELLRAPAAVADREIATALPVLQDWRARTSTGDRAELRDLPEEAPIWAAVRSDPETRIGPRCRFHEDCFVTAARRRAERARIVVVNHHLFFADLALRAAGGAGVIPAYEALIFDEAHQIDEVATAFFGVQLGAASVEVLVRDVERALAAARVLDPIATGLLRTVLLHGSAIFETLPRDESAPEGSRMPLPESVLDGGVRAALFALDRDLEALADALRARAADLEVVAQLVRRVESMRGAIARLAEPGHDHVVWITWRNRGARLGASPVDVSSLFRDEVLHRVPSVVLTSATLATGGSFAFARRRLGIDFEVDEEILPSAFDHARQAALYLADLPDPRAPEFLEAAATEIDRLVALTAGGAFVLCTSYRVMHALLRRLRAALERRGHLVLAQGEADRSAQLERFRADGDAVLFATQSFWEGVDVPGRALRLVIIDRLPFDVPTDPLVRARSERLRAEGASPFMEYFLPAAALGLKQGFGRLIRTAQDRGIVAILDARVRTKGYGKVFLRSLPPARRCTSFDEVEAFWRGEPDRPVTG